MSFIVKDKPGGADFAPISAAMHHSVCYAIIDIGTQPQFGNYPARRKVFFLWEIPGERISVEKNGVKQDLPRAISQKYTLSLATKSNMRPMLESWRGRPFTPKDLEGFDLKNVLGANCFLNVVHAQGKGDKANRIYANVASVNPLAKGMAPLKAENPLLIFSMDEFTGPVVIPAAVPEWIAEQIKQSEEYKQKANGGSVQDHSHSTPAIDTMDEDPPF